MRWLCPLCRSESSPQSGLPRQLALGIGETLPLLFFSPGDLISPGLLDGKIWLGGSSRGIRPAWHLAHASVYQLQSRHPSLPSCFTALTLPCQSPPCRATSECHSADSALGNASVCARALMLLNQGSFSSQLSARRGTACAQSLTPPFLDTAPSPSGPTPSLWVCKPAQGSGDRWHIMSLKAPSSSFIPNSPHTQTTHVNEQLKSSSLARIR